MEDDRLIHEKATRLLNATTKTGPISANALAHQRVLEAYIETLKAENEILKRRLAAADARAAERARPWWRRIVR